MTAEHIEQPPAPHEIVQASEGNEEENDGVADGNEKSHDDGDRRDGEDEISFSEEYKSQSSGQSDGETDDDQDDEENNINSIDKSLDEIRKSLDDIQGELDD